MKDMPCPHGWINCRDCENVKLCQSGKYDPEKELVEMIEELEEETQQEEKKEIIKKDLITEFTSLNPEQRLEKFYEFRTQGLHYKEPIPLDGPSAPGGGSKAGKRKKSKKGNKVYIGVWEGI